jgi:hypothetical protein
MGSEMGIDNCINSSKLEGTLKSFEDLLGKEVV